MDELHTHAGLPPRKGTKESDAKENCDSMKDDSEHIHKKPKGSLAAASKCGCPKKTCALCVKFSPSINGTHNTKECRKWNRDRTPQRKDTNNYHRKGHYVNAVVRSDELEQCFAQMKKDQKALKKPILKQGKKSRKHLKRCVLLDSDDSSDDSE